MVIVGFSATSLPSAGAGYELDIITAVLLGGASLEGGEGSVWRTLLGVVIIGIINNGMALLNVPPYWQILSKGALLLLAVAADKLKQ
jgi:ribose transport system permease protein